MHDGDGKAMEAEIRNVGKRRINAVSSFLPRCGVASILISYDLNPPLGIDAAGLKRSRASSHQKDVLSNAHTTYYAYLRTAIAAARDELGEELTRRRDVVGREEMGEGARRRRRRRRRTVIVLGNYTSTKNPGHRILGVILVQNWNRNGTRTQYARDRLERGSK
ncbi:hypothetical protein C8J56DRAFT_888860 [Mycena floridula]|nr:hypothetical protein C8J56DRAFT_888860 [Mycena floridula]